MKTLQSFKPSSSNELAVSAAEQIIRNPGTRYNPFFVYGKSGSGKTRLLRAIQHAFSEEGKEIRVIYADGKKFVLDLENAAKEGMGAAFKKPYRHCDVLIVDDIDALSRGEKSQKIFMQLVAGLLADGKQVIAASETSPVDLPLMGKCVRYYDTALICDIAAPIG